MMTFLLRNLPRKSHTSPWLLTITSRFLSSETLNPSRDDALISDGFDSRICRYGKYRDFVAVCNLIRYRWRMGGSSTKNTFNFINRCTRDLPVIIRELSKALTKTYEGSCRTTAFEALISRLSMLNEIEQSLRVADVMVRGGYGATARTFHPILDAITNNNNNKKKKKKEKMDEAWNVVRVMKEEYEIPPDKTIYNYILTAYGSYGDMEAVAGVMLEAEEEGLEADATTYDALVLGACRGRKLEGALAMLRRVEDDGVRLPYSTYVDVMFGLMGEGYSEMAIEFMKCYGGRDERLGKVIFESLAMRFVHLNRVEEAKVVLEEMRKRNLPLRRPLKDFCSMIQWATN